MLTKLEKAKLLHQHEHYRLNCKFELEKGNVELAKEYEIKLEAMKRVLDIFELTAWGE